MAGSNVQFSFSLSLSLFNRIRAWYRVDFAQSGGQLDGRKDRSGVFQGEPERLRSVKGIRTWEAIRWLLVCDGSTNVSIILPTDDKAVLILQPCHAPC